jgi:hypothetical protein
MANLFEVSIKALFTGDIFDFAFSSQMKFHRGED